MKESIKKFLRIDICLLIFYLLGFTFYSQAEVVQLDDILEVTLVVKAPFSTATIIIDNQRQITYTASSPNMGIDKITDSASITLEQYHELIDLIKCNNFFTLDEKYIEENLADATSYTVTVKKDHQIKSVICYGTCPDSVWKIINKIKELWGKEILEVGV